MVRTKEDVRRLRYCYYRHYFHPILRTIITGAAAGDFITVKDGGILAVQTLSAGTLTTIGNAATLLEVGLNFTKSSIDYRDPDTKVGYFMPSGALWDPEQQVCKSFDPDDPVSRLQD